MRINRGREFGTSSSREVDHFTGTVFVDQVLGTGNGPARSSNVFFAPGARTHWHTHDGGQILYVTAGEGRVATRDSPARVIAPGDVVHVDAHEEHWHGAGPDTMLLHLSVSLGATDWLEPVNDEEYA